MRRGEKTSLLRILTSMAIMYHPCLPISIFLSLISSAHCNGPFQKRPPQCIGKFQSLSSVVPSATCLPNLASLSPIPFHARSPAGALYWWQPAGSSRGANSLFLTLLEPKRWLGAWPSRCIFQLWMVGPQGMPAAHGNARRGMLLKMQPTSIMHELQAPGANCMKEV